MLLHGPEVQALVAQARAEQRVDCEEAMALLRQQITDRDRYPLLYSILHMGT